MEYPTQPTPIPPPPGPPPASAPKDNTKLVWLVAGGIIVLVVMATVMYLVTRPDKKDPSTSVAAGATTSTAPATTTSSAPPTTRARRTTTTAAPTTTTAPATTVLPVTTTPPPPPAPAPGPGTESVLDEPSGLFCKDLKAKGYTFADAVDYWTSEGSPDRMDADKNGIPCETVYPVSEVGDYFESSPGVAPSSGLPSGLFCKDLVARGFTYPEAVAYWFDEGAPDRMDADKNGRPCETVYSDVDVFDYWVGS